MELVIEKLTEIISKELSNSTQQNKHQEFEKLLKDMQNAGVIKKPVYEFPLVDTIGKTYYSTINKRNIH